MPKASNTVTNATTSGQLEDVAMMLLSDAVKLFNAKTLADSIILVVPDTGKAKFSPSHEYVKTKAKDGNPAVMAQSKAVFVIAEIGTQYANAPLNRTTDDMALYQSVGPTTDLPLGLKLSVIATPPNRDATTVEDALKTDAQIEAELKAHNDKVDSQRANIKAA